MGQRAAQGGGYAGGFDASQSAAGDYSGYGDYSAYGDYSGGYGDYSGGYGDYGTADTVEYAGGYGDFTAGYGAAAADSSAWTAGRGQQRRVSGPLGRHSLHRTAHW